MIFFLVPTILGTVIGSANAGEFSIAGLGVGALIGVIFAVLFFLPNYKALKPVKFQRGARNYYRPGSMVLDRKEDNFLYKTVTKTRINNK